MNTWLKTDIMGKHLLTEAPSGCEFENSMIQSIRDAYMITPTFCYRENTRCLSYDITGKRNLEEIYHNRQMDTAGITGLVLCLIHVMESARDYLLSEQNILLDSDHIYLDYENQRIQFCVHPEVEEPFRSALHRLFGFVVAHTDRTDPEALRMAVELYSQSGEKDCVVQELIHVIQNGRPRENPERPEEWEGAMEYRWDKDSPPVRYEETEPDQRLDAKDRVRDKVPPRLPPEIAMPDWDKSTGMNSTIFRTIILRLGISQAIMLLGLFAVFLLKGMNAVQHALPVYLILCFTIAGYFMIDMLLEKRKATRSTTIENI